MISDEKVPKLRNISPKPLTLTKISIRNWVNEIFEKPYLLVIDTSRIVQYKPASHVFLQFDFDKEFSPNAFEKFLSNTEVQRFYSCALTESFFSSGNVRSLAPYSEESLLLLALNLN